MYSIEKEIISPVEEKKITFSIIVPTFNRAERLKIALNSLVSQNYKNFEVIICDDGSTDNTKEVVESFEDKLAIQYIWNENWGGPARPRNIGINASKADWICFLDSDDWWYPNKLEMSTVFINHYDLIYHDLDIYSKLSKDSRSKIKGRKLKRDFFCDLIIKGNAIPNSSVIVKKELLMQVGGISEDPALIAVEDYDCWIRIAQIDNKFKYIKKSLGAYWMGNNISSASEKIIHAEQFVTNKYIDQLKDHDKYQALCNLSYRFGRLFQNLNDNEKAFFYYKKSIFSESLGIKLRSILIILKIKINQALNF